MATPTLQATYTGSSGFGDNSTPKTATVTTAAGDVLVVVGLSGDSGTTLATPTGNSLTFTLVQSVTTSQFTGMWIWSATDSVGGINWTLSVSASSGITLEFWDFIVYRFSGSSGVGGSNKATSASGAPSASVTTLQANSALVTVNGDWTASDGTSRVWRTINSITPTAGNGLETLYFRDAAHYGAYAAYYNDAAATGAKTIGLSAPSAQKYSLGGIEVKGVASSWTSPAVYVVNTTAVRAVMSPVPGRATLVRPVSASTPWTADATVPETFGLTADATRAVTAAATVASTVSISVAATVASAATPQPAVFDFTDAAARVQPTQGRALIVRPVTTGAAASADASIAETFGLTAAATRNAGADTPFPETFGLAAAASVASPVVQPAVFDFTDAAARQSVAQGRFLLVRPVGSGATGTADVALGETFALTTAATVGSATTQAAVFDFTDAAAAVRPLAGRVVIVRPAITPSTGPADAALAEVFALTADATASGSAQPQPAVLDFTSAAVETARVLYGRQNEPLLLRAPTDASTASTADVALTETFALSTAATRAAAADAAISEAFGLAAGAVRDAAASTAIAVTVGLSVAATATAGNGVTIGETFGLTAAAARATSGAAAVPETFALTASATRATTAVATVAETFALTVSAVNSSQPVKASSAESVTARRTSADPVEARRQSLAGVS